MRVGESICTDVALENRDVDRIRLASDYRAAWTYVPCCNNCIQADICAYVEHRHTLTQNGAKHRELKPFVHAKRQRARNNGSAGLRYSRPSGSATERGRIASNIALTA